MVTEMVLTAQALAMRIGVHIYNAELVDPVLGTMLFGETSLSSDINANIQDLGWGTLPETNNLALIPSAYPDLMSYCRAGNGGPADTGNTPTSGNDANTGAPWNLPYVTNQTKWMSTYHYLYLYDQLSDWDTSNPLI